MRGTWKAENNTIHGLIVFSGPNNSGVVKSAYLGLGVVNTNSSAKGHVWFFGGAGGDGTDDAPVLEDLDYELRANTVWSHPCPKNTAYVVVSVVETNQEVDWYLELEAQ
jgi:hypothetical protein